MALMKSNFTASGRFGGVYFKKDRYGQHIQAMPRFIRGISLQDASHASFSRGLLIKAFSWCCWNWKALLASFIPLLWLTFSQQNLFTKKNGDKIRLMPHLWFNHYNIKRVYLEHNVWYYPPNHVNETPPYYAAGHAFGTYGNPVYPAGNYGGQTMYRFAVGSLFLWWDGNMWWVSISPGYKPTNYAWFRPSPDIDGTYIPVNPLDQSIYITE